MNIKIYPVSLGCPKNSIDTEYGLASIASSCRSFSITGSPDDANVILVNTCGFIQASVEESIDTILEMAAVKSAGQLLIVTGCLVQRYGSAVLAGELPEVDLFSGVSGYEKLGMMIAGKFGGSALSASQPGNRILTTPPWRAYVRISEGCSNNCAYCLIPAIRGRQVSRPPEDITGEIQTLCLAGVKEVTLVAQDLTAYAYGGIRLPELLERIMSETDISWLRMLYLYPSRINEKLLETVSSNARICPYFDIPVQHASDRILKLMNRKYDRNGLSRVIRMIRECIPEAAIRTTLITGFPGETRRDFSIMKEFVAEHGFDHLGCFIYSDEEESSAYNLPDKVKTEVAENRMEEIMEVQQKICSNRNGRLYGKRVEVLVEGPGRETDLLLEGRTMMQAPEIDGLTYITDGNAAPGDIVEVEITETHIYDIAGRIISNPL